VPTEQPKAGSSRDFFLELYRTYNRYHNEKETLVWLAANTYLVAVGAATGWLVTHPVVWATTGSYLRWWLFGSLFLVCLASTYFAWRQNTMKVRSVVTTNMLDNLLNSFGTRAEPTFAQLQGAVKRWQRMCCQQRRSRSRRDGWPGWALVFLMAALGIALLVLIACYPPVDP
jgi:hypothetical protein